jgi:hypothetical protein
MHGQSVECGRDRMGCAVKRGDVEAGMVTRRRGDVINQPDLKRLRLSGFEFQFVILQVNHHPFEVAEKIHPQQTVGLLSQTF